MKNTKKTDQTKNTLNTEDEISKFLGEFPANDNICGLSGFEDVPADNDNEEDVGFAELGFSPMSRAQPFEEDAPMDALEEESREELDFYDERPQKRGFLAEAPLSYDD